MTDIYLKIKTSAGDTLDAKTRRIPKRMATALKNNGLGLLLGRDGNKDFVHVASRDVAINFIRNYVVTLGTYDADGNLVTAPVFGGPLLMIRFHSPRAARAWLKNKDKIALYFEKIPQPSTIGGWL